MKRLLYTLGWPWLFRFTRWYLNLDLEKDILPDGSVKYTWSKWMPNKSLEALKALAEAQRHDQENVPGSVVMNCDAHDALIAELEKV